MLTVHASGGIEMMRAAVESTLQVYAVTVLTSLDEQAVRQVYNDSPEAVVVKFALLAKTAGVHGIVCSPQEVDTLAKTPELSSMTLITPGIRSPGKATDDQRRVDTPGNAIASGANYLVVGRGVTEAEDPDVAVNIILANVSIEESIRKARQCS